MKSNKISRKPLFGFISKKVALFVFLGLFSNVFAMEDQQPQEDLFISIIDDDVISLILRDVCCPGYTAKEWLRALHNIKWTNNSCRQMVNRFIRDEESSKSPIVPELILENLDKIKPLHFFAIAGNLKMVKWLLANGANVNEPAAFNGRTALHFAATYGHEKIVEYLCSVGADVEAVVFCDCWTPLFYAACEGRDKCVDVLLHHRANVDARDTDQGTPLIVAVRMRHLEAVISLLKGKANVNAANREGETPLRIAVRVFVRLVVGRNLSCKEMEDREVYIDIMLEIMSSLKIGGVLFDGRIVEIAEELPDGAIRARGRLEKALGRVIFVDAYDLLRHEGSDGCCVIL